MRQTKSKTLTNIGKPWTKADINRLSRMYPDTSDRIIGENLGRTQTAIHTRAAMLCLKKNRAAVYRRLRNRKLWTKNEIRLLIKLYPIMTADEIAEKFDCSSFTIVGKANMLGLKKNIFWSREQIDFIKKFYQTTTCAQLAEKLGKTKDSILAMGRRLNLKRKKASHWTDEEIKLLRQLHNTVKIKEIVQKLGRSPYLIKIKIRNLGLKKKPSWSKEQIDYVRESYPTMTYSQIAKGLGKNDCSVRNMIYKLKLIKKKPIHTINAFAQKSRGEKTQEYVPGIRKLKKLRRIIWHWTDEEIKFLQENYASHSNAWLAEKLKKPLSALNAFAQMSGIRKTREFLSIMHKARISGQKVDF